MGTRHIRFAPWRNSRGVERVWPEWHMGDGQWRKATTSYASEAEGKQAMSLWAAGHADVELVFEAYPIPKTSKGVFISYTDTEADKLISAIEMLRLPYGDAMDTLKKLYDDLKRQRK